MSVETKVKETLKKVPTKGWQGLLVGFIVGVLVDLFMQFVIVNKLAKFLRGGIKLPFKLWIAEGHPEPNIIHWDDLILLAVGVILVVYAVVKRKTEGAIGWTFGVGFLLGWYVSSQWIAPKFRSEEQK